MGYLPKNIPKEEKRVRKLYLTYDHLNRMLNCTYSFPSVLPPNPRTPVYKIVHFLFSRPWSHRRSIWAYIEWTGGSMKSAHDALYRLQGVGLVTTRTEYTANHNGKWPRLLYTLTPAGFRTYCFWRMYIDHLLQSANEMYLYGAQALLRGRLKTRGDLARTYENLYLAECLARIYGKPVLPPPSHGDLERWRKREKADQPRQKYTLRWKAAKDADLCLMKRLSSERFDFLVRSPNVFPEKQGTQYFGSFMSFVRKFDTRFREYSRLHPRSAKLFDAEHIDE